MNWIGYIDRKTFLHQIDPRIKIIWFVVMTILVVVYRNPLVLAILLFSCFALWRMSGIMDQIGSMMKRLLPLLILSFLTWLFLGILKDGQSEILCSIGGVSLETDDLRKAIVAIMRIFLMVTVFLQ